jgi:hypothetical protein
LANFTLNGNVTTLRMTTQVQVLEWPTTVHFQCFHFAPLSGTPALSYIWNRIINWKQKFHLTLWYNLSSLVP